MSGRTGNVSKQISENIRVWRARNQVARKTLAEQAGISVAFLGRIESGRQSVTVEPLARIAQAMGTDIGRLTSSQPW